MPKKRPPTSLPHLTEDEIKRLASGHSAFVEDMREIMGEDREYGTHPTDSVCPICGGRVMRDTSRAYFGDPMQMIMGPGSKNQMTTVTQYYCETCKVIFVSPPPVIPKKK